MRAMRHWSVRHARALKTIYDGFEAAMTAGAPLWRALGYARVERAVLPFERVVKGFLFDCRMCGACVLSSTGMACPMNCPKRLRNGPCGGVRESGACEVKPGMRCVWVEAWEGARRIDGGVAIRGVLEPVDRSREGCSAWLAAVRARAGEGAAEARGG